MEGPHLAQLLPAAPKFRLRRVTLPWPRTWAFAPLSPMLSGCSSPEWLSTTSLRPAAERVAELAAADAAATRRVHLLAVCPPAVPNLPARPRRAKPRGCYSALKPPTSCLL